MFPINTLLQIRLPPICNKCSKAKLNLRVILYHRLIPTGNPLVRKSLLAAKNQLVCSLGDCVLSPGGHTTRHPGHVKPRRRRKYWRVGFKAPTFSEDSREDMDRIVVRW